MNDTSREWRTVREFYLKNASKTWRPSNSISSCVDRIFKSRYVIEAICKKTSPLKRALITKFSYGRLFNV